MSASPISAYYLATRFTWDTGVTECLQQTLAAASTAVLFCHEAKHPIPGPLHTVLSETWDSPVVNKFVAAQLHFVYTFCILLEQTFCSFTPSSLMLILMEMALLTAPKAYEMGTAP